VSAPGLLQQCPLPELVDGIGRDREGAIRAAERERGDGPELRKLVGDHHLRLAEEQLDMHEASVRHADPAADLVAKRVRTTRPRAP
jgi:hypothetical protein